MARVILDVPTEKMQPFLKAILNLGLDHHAIHSDHARRHNQPLSERKNFLKHFSGPFLLFDWEFFSNELEYE